MLGSLADTIYTHTNSGQKSLKYTDLNYPRDLKPERVWLGIHYFFFLRDRVKTLSHSVTYFVDMNKPKGTSGVGEEGREETNFFLLKLGCPTHKIRDNF